MFSPKTRAAVITGTTDTTGAVTGTVGATYYNVAAWQDISDTYKWATTNLPTGTNVYFNVTADVPGASIIYTGIAIVNGYSVTINGNNHRLYLDNDTNYTTAQTPGNSTGSGTGGFDANNGKSISSSTTLELDNATVCNDIRGGIFQVVGNAAATTIYNNVTTYNGATNYAGVAIANQQGNIIFRGNNNFNALEGGNFTNNSHSGADTNGNIIVGGANIEVQTGTTNFNLNWYDDNCVTPYNETTAGAVWTIDPGATWNWNVNNNAALFYSYVNNYPFVWNINGNFTINVANSASSNWFYNNLSNGWIVNVGAGGQWIVNSAAGTCNLNYGGAGNYVQWNFAKGSKVLINSLKSGNVISGNPGTAKAPNGLSSGIYLTDTAAFTLTSNTGSNIFGNMSGNFPITLTAGDTAGLRTHFASAGYTFVNGGLQVGVNYGPTDNGSSGTTLTLPADDLTAPNEQDIASTGDIWYRINTGQIKGIGSTASQTLTPNPYSSADLTSINSAKYVSWYQPVGINVYANQSAMAKLFKINLNSDVPTDGSWSALITLNGTGSGTSGRNTLTVGDDRGQSPNFSVTTTMLANQYPNGLQYYWTDPTSGNSTQYTTNTAIPIATVTSDSNLPSWITMKDAGGYYVMNFASNYGINIKANNTLPTVTNADSGTFQYTIADGPA